jgi:flagellar hook-associated protein 1 FlgK
MGLLGALQTSVSALNINQQNLNVLSQNIANANTPNYSNEVVNQTAVFINGQGAGVSLASITRSVNEFLNSEMQTQTSVNGQASVVQSYYTNIENLLGAPGSTNSIDQNINSFMSALQNMANSQSSESETTAVDAGATLATQVSSLATSLYNLQYQADQDISTSIKSANADLQSLQKLNISIEQASASSQSTAGLLDQRDALLTDLSKYLSIQTNFGSDGEVNIGTSGGTSLLSNGTVAQLNYSAATGVSTFTNNGKLGAITISTLDSNGLKIGTASLTSSGTASSITSSIQGGQIAGLLNMRDSVIPNTMNQLDQMASKIRDQVNAINNAGTSFPPPHSYTGTRQVAASTTSQYSGSVQVAVLTSTGQPIPSPYADEPNGMQPFTLNLGSLNYGNGPGVLSADNIVSAINQYYGVQQSKLEIGNLNNVQLTMASNNVTGANGSTINFGFNVNNISGSSSSFAVSGATIYAGDPSSGVVAGSIPGSISTTVGTGTTMDTNSLTNGTMTATLNNNASSAAYFTVVATVQTVDGNGNPIQSQVSYQIPNNSSNVANNMIGATAQTGSGTIVAPTSTQPLATAELVDANGNPLPLTNGSYGNQQGYLKIIANGGTQTIALNQLNSKQVASGQGFSQYFGLNNFFNSNSLTPTGDTVANSALNLSVNANILSNPGTISTGTLSIATQPTTGKPNYTYQVSAGDNSNSQALSKLSTASINFDAAGGLASTSTTLSQYAGQVIAFTSSNSSAASSTATDSQTVLNGFTSRAQAVSGVNLDQELANTQIYQNAYAASAKVISVLGQLFESLVNIIGG